MNQRDAIGNVPLHEWVDGELEPLPEPEVAPIWSADAEIKRREAELSEHLAQGPPARGSAAAPITWLFEPETFTPIARLQGGKSQSILSDHLGTPTLMVDDGDAIWSADISTWGDLRNLKGDRHACPFRWPGQYEDAETGLYYNRFRYYDPVAGEYVSQDPVGVLAGIRFYGYVANPVRHVDLLGLVEQVLTEGRVYRGGGDTDANFTPRPGSDVEGHKRGLSTFQDVESAAKPGKKAQVIDTAKLGPDVKQC